jgi:hypothetical protein
LLCVLKSRCFLANTNTFPEIFPRLGAFDFPFFRNVNKFLINSISTRFVRPIAECKLLGASAIYRVYIAKEYAKKKIFQLKNLNLFENKILGRPTTPGNQESMPKVDSQTHFPVIRFLYSSMDSNICQFL